MLLSMPFKMLIFITFLVQNLWAVSTIVDIDESKVFTSYQVELEGRVYRTGMSQLRVASYNTDEQRFLGVSYFFSERDKRSVSDLFGFNIDIAHERKTPGEGHLKVEVVRCAMPENVWLLVPIGTAITSLPETHESVSFEQSVPFEQDTVRKRCVLIRNKTARPKNFLTLRAVLQQSFARSEGSTFTVNIYPDHTGLSSPAEPTGESSFLAVDKGRANAEQRTLGELATDWTFFVHGFTKLDSKLRGDRDNGIDGVFVDQLASPTIVYATESKFRSRPFSTEDFEKSIGPATLERTISDGYVGTRVGTILQMALTGRFLSILGHTFLLDGRIKSSYLHFGADKILSITFPELRKKLAFLKKGKHRNDNAVLARELGVNAEVLRTFLNGRTESSPHLRLTFLAYINAPEHEGICRELFPPADAKEKTEDDDKPRETLPVAAQEVAIATGYNKDELVQVRKALDEMSSQGDRDVEDLRTVFDTIYLTEAIFTKFFHLWRHRQSEN